MTKDYTCPNCDRAAHVVCGKTECVCLSSIPDGELPLSHHWAIGPVVTSDRFGNLVWSLWRRLGFMKHIHAGRFMLELERCPYCGFTNSVDFWFERELQLLDAYDKGISPTS